MKPMGLLRSKSTKNWTTPRNQLRYVLAATAAGLSALIIYTLVAYRWDLPPIHYLIEIGVVLTLSISIIRHRLMDINLAITRTAVFMAVYTSVLGLPLLAALAWQEQLGYFLGTRWWVFLWIVCSGLTTTAHYTNLYFQKKAEERLLGEQRRYQAILRRASQGMTLIKELDRLMDLIVHLCTKEVRIRHAVIYLWDE